MAERELAPIECPRGNAAHNEVWIDRDDPRHTRECAVCQYTWEYRPGMPTYPGESFAEAAPEPTTKEVPADGGDKPTTEEVPTQ